ncbi:MAG TPA: DoxX family protein [Pyrinomonadaceae bacterium]|nr:DoxX family protein [Pyrinomonadaceae bacterium]
MNILLWIIQILLGLLFLFAGGTKFYYTIEQMRAMGSPNQIMFPGWFIHFIGVCEILGGLGLILPGLTRIKPFLTVLAAIGLTIIMVGAFVVVALGDGIGPAVPNLVIALLCAFVAYGRTKLRPFQS